MSRFLKTVVLYLSMLLIPVQGYAASTMLHCGPAHQHTPSAQETAHASAHGHANSADHQHQGGDRGLAKGGEAGVHDGSEHAACPVGAAISASSLGFQPAEQTIEPIAPNHFLNIAFVTDAPARPPRSFLA